MDNFISSIDNQKIRLIVRLRLVEFKSWNDIADEITPEDEELVDRTSLYNALKRYFEKNNQMSHRFHW